MATAIEVWIFPHANLEFFIIYTKGVFRLSDRRLLCEKLLLPMIRMGYTDNATEIYRKCCVPKLRTDIPEDASQLIAYGFKPFGDDILNSTYPDMSSVIEYLEIGGLQRDRYEFYIWLFVEMEWWDFREEFSTKLIKAALRQGWGNELLQVVRRCLSSDSNLVFDLISNAGSRGLHVIDLILENIAFPEMPNVIWANRPEFGNGRWTQWIFDHCTGYTGGELTYGNHSHLLAFQTNIINAGEPTLMALLRKAKNE